ncbi:MAG: T9SS type A sorting domain-containing protein [Saprospiraceae bacterium]
MCFPLILGSQIYRWDADEIQPGLEPNDCALPDVYHEGEQTFGSMQTSIGNSIFWGTENVLLAKNICDWHYGVFRTNLNNTYEIIDYLTHGNWGDQKNFMVIGKAQVLSNDENGWPTFPTNNPEYVLDYGGKDFYFNFPVEHHKKNVFYTFKMNVVSEENLTEASTMTLGVNTDFEEPNIPFEPWLQGNPISQSIVQNQKRTMSVYNKDNEYVEFDFDIFEPPFSSADYYCQIGLTLNLPPPSSYIILADEFELDCDNKNIFFDFNIHACALNQMTTCTNPMTCLELTTNCTNVAFANFPHRFRFTNVATNQTYYFDGQGQYTQLDLSIIPHGEYQVSIEYNTNTGYNIKVSNLQSFLVKSYTHQPISQYEINENTTFDSPIYVPRDIVVNSPATLTVKDFAYFADNTKLIVKPGASLVVEGLGHLTACDNRWDGVIAEGNAKIIVNNNGSISFAKTGIFAKGDGASTITLSRAHFINNTVGLHALKSAIPVVELSYFTEGLTGVLLDNVTGGTAPNGVYFRGNEFAFMSREGILSYNTPIQVEDGNEFSYCYDGIALRNLFASNEQSYLGLKEALNNEGYNLFENNRNAVYINGSDINIENNIFSNNVYGGFYSGFSSIETERNNFSGTNGERYSGTGNNSSYSQYNEYNTGTGITALFDNTDYTFLSNCFQTSAWDVLAVNGDIAKAQGTSSLAASNCFTGGTVPDFACGTPSIILYFTPDVSVSHPPCLDPDFAGNYEVKDNSAGEDSGDCGTSFLPPSPGEYSYIRSLGCNLTLLNNHINSLRSQINAILIQPQQISDLDKANLSWLSRHLRYAQQRLARCLRRQGLKQELYTFYKAQNEKDFDIAASGVLFDMGLVSDALLSLDTAWNIHGGDSLVLQGLKLNLLYRDSLNRSPLNSTDILTLKTVAAKSDPYAGYARALLYKITGERIEPDTTIVIPRTRKTTDNNLSEKYLTSPNPAQDIIYIYIENYLEDFEYTFKMYDIMGNMVKSGALKERSEIPVLELSEGMYFIQMHKNNTQQETLRTILLH